MNHDPQPSFSPKFDETQYPSREACDELREKIYEESKKRMAEHEERKRQRRLKNKGKAHPHRSADRKSPKPGKQIHSSPAGALAETTREKTAQPGYPLWMPQGKDLEQLHGDLRQAAEEIVRPTYEALVLKAAPGLEQSLGASLAHLLWLEIFDQFEIKREYAATSCLPFRLPGSRRQDIEHHLRLLDAKLRYGKFMLRVEEFRRLASKSQQLPNQPTALLPIAETPASPRFLPASETNAFAAPLPPPIDVNEPDAETGETLTLKEATIDTRDNNSNDESHDLELA